MQYAFEWEPHLAPHAHIKLLFVMACVRTVRDSFYKVVLKSMKSQEPVGILFVSIIVDIITE